MLSMLEIHSLWLHQIPAVEILRQVWIHLFYAPGEDGSVQWRTTKDRPPSTVAIHSPYDVAAHYSSKRSVDWVGYKAHVTEICGEECPHFITQVYTTLSTISDDAAVEPLSLIHIRRSRRYAVCRSRWSPY